MSNGTGMIGVIIHAIVTISMGLGMIVLGLLAISAWLM